VSKRSGEGRQPNIVYLMTDQQKALACSVYGNRRVPSPFMDEMAARGVAFTQAYAASPICTPSRATVFTGTHPLVHQVTCHQNRAPYNLPQLSELLKENGYYTAAAGHFEHDRNLTRGWHEQTSFQ
jgi:arylsulfatase A-like enzyme